MISFTVHPNHRYQRISFTLKAFTIRHFLPKVILRGGIVWPFTDYYKLFAVKSKNSDMLWTLTNDWQELEWVVQFRYHRFARKRLNQYKICVVVDWSTQTGGYRWAVWKREDCCHAWVGSIYWPATGGMHLVRRDKIFGRLFGFLWKSEGGTAEKPKRRCHEPNSPSLQGKREWVKRIVAAAALFCLSCFWNGRPRIRSWTPR